MIILAENTIMYLVRHKNGILHSSMFNQTHFAVVMETQVQLNENEQ